MRPARYGARPAAADDAPEFAPSERDLATVEDLAWLALVRARVHVERHPSAVRPTEAPAAAARRIADQYLHDRP